MRMYIVKAKMSKDDDWYVLKVCIGVKDKALNEATEIKERAKNIGDTCAFLSQQL